MTITRTDEHQRSERARRDEVMRLSQRPVIAMIEADPDQAILRRRELGQAREICRAARGRFLDQTLTELKRDVVRFIETNSGAGHSFLLP